jgi:hypothetical protein
MTKAEKKLLRGSERLFRATICLPDSGLFFTCPPDERKLAQTLLQELIQAAEPVLQKIEKFWSL